MILVVIWYEYHTSVFAVYDGMHVRQEHDCDTTLQLTGLGVFTWLSNSFHDQGTLTKLLVVNQHTYSHP